MSYPGRCQAKNPANCWKHGVAGMLNAPSTVRRLSPVDGPPGHEAYEQIRSVTKSGVILPDAQLRHLQALPLKRASVEDLANMVVTEAARAGMDRERIASALHLAGFLHRDDIRSDISVGSGAPYIGHPLRNAVRGLRMGSESETVLIGNLMHDTVEDHPIDLAAFGGFRAESPEEARPYALKFVKDQYGDKVEAMVSGMSNPLMPRYMPAEEKNRIYANHVEEAIENPDVLVGKACDLKDNALSLKYSRHHMSDVSVAKKARKYLPVLGIIQNRFEQLTVQELGISAHGRDHMIMSLEDGRIWLQELSTLDRKD